MDANANANANVDVDVNVHDPVENLWEFSPHCFPTTASTPISILVLVPVPHSHWNSYATKMADSAQWALAHCAAADDDRRHSPAGVVAVAADDCGNANAHGDASASASAAAHADNAATGCHSCPAATLTPV